MTNYLYICQKQGDHTVLPATHSWTISVFIPQLQSITAVWLVLSAPTHRGMAGWVDLVTGYIFSHNGSWTLDTVTHPITNRGKHRVISLMRHTTKPNHQRVTKNYREHWPLQAPVSTEQSCAQLRWNLRDSTIRSALPFPWTTPAGFLHHNDSKWISKSIRKSVIITIAASLLDCKL